MGYYIYSIQKIEIGELLKSKKKSNTYQEKEQEQGQGGEEVDHAVVEPAHLPLIHWAELSIRLLEEDAINT